ncbi:AMP-binding protein [Bradyrhizobium sp. BR 1432]|uniref:AMP-binding protein n=1 Tax=Bradyrhizobium sp. BR 1432 TaxID=3447966 RepID=UPI003EE65DFD
MLNARAQDNEAVAVIDARGIYSFKQVRGYVAATAERMNAAGRGDDVVVVYGSHGLHIYVGVLAALSSGSRVLFVDQATPIGAVDHIIRALDASLLVNCSGSAQPAAVAGVAVIDIAQDMFHRDIARGVGPYPPLKLSCSDYAILTSGTTGEPKVILQTIRIARCAHHELRWLPWRTARRPRPPARVRRVGCRFNGYFREISSRAVPCVRSAPGNMNSTRSSNLSRRTISTRST